MIYNYFQLCWCSLSADAQRLGFFEYLGKMQIDFGHYGVQRVRQGCNQIIIVKI